MEQLKVQDAQLRSDVARNEADTDKRLLDFDERLLFFETKKAVAAMENAGNPVSPAPAPAVATAPASNQPVSVEPAGARAGRGSAGDQPKSGGWMIVPTRQAGGFGRDGYERDRADPSP
ncbi:MAG: hypothetical protein JO122_00670 [Acetobacteraceae bacterium]|nr:hypothetical protein [Acetobacteraceae bacterium]